MILLRAWLLCVSDKNGIFDVVTSCSIFDKNIFPKNTFLISCYALSSMICYIHECEASKKCQVS